MCYSPEVSIGTFGFVVLGSAYLWVRNRPLDRGLAVLFGSIALMQLVEFVLWHVVDRCDDTNRLAGKLIPLALVIQPVLILWAAWKFDMGWAFGYKQLFWAGLAAAAYTLWNIYSRDDGRCVVVDANGHLTWPRYTYSIDSWITYLLYWGGIAYVQATLKNKLLAVLLIAAHMWSYRAAQAADGGWPSVYCHTVNALVVLAILFN